MKCSERLYYKVSPRCGIRPVMCRMVPLVLFIGLFTSSEPKSINTRQNANSESPKDDVEVFAPLHPNGYIPGPGPRQIPPGPLPGFPGWPNSTPRPQYPSYPAPPSLPPYPIPAPSPGPYPGTVYPYPPALPPRPSFPPPPPLPYPSQRPAYSPRSYPWYPSKKPLPGTKVPVYPSFSKKPIVPSPVFPSFISSTKSTTAAPGKTSTVLAFWHHVTRFPFKRQTSDGKPAPTLSTTYNRTTRSTPFYSKSTNAYGSSSTSVARSTGTPPWIYPPRAIRRRRPIK